MNDSTETSPETTHSDRHDAEKRLDHIGWGLFFILFGCILLIPEELLPDGTFLMGLGAIFIGLNIARHVQGRSISTFWTVIGVILLVMGISEFYGLELPVIPVVIILIGVSLIVKPLFRKNKTTGKSYL